MHSKVFAFIFYAVCSASLFCFLDKKYIRRDFFICFYTISSALFGLFKDISFLEKEKTAPHSPLKTIG
ncbi:hypothetical protein HR11_08740 [Porphyromonas macacae]|nr:hypothetical protein HR11_08740 [Porphyromonas macacae]